MTSWKASVRLVEGVGVAEIGEHALAGDDGIDAGDVGSIGDLGRALQPLYPQATAG